MRRLLLICLMLVQCCYAQVTTAPSVSGVPAPQSSVSITGGTIDGVAIGQTTQATGAFTTIAFPIVENTITAHAGGGQGSATALSATATFHRITTVTTSADSVALPTASSGAFHCIRNDSSSGNSVQVFGASPDTINAVATGTGVALSNAVGVCFISTAANTWVTTAPATGYSGSGNGVRMTSPTLTSPTTSGATVLGTGPSTVAVGTSTINSSPAAEFQVNGTSGAFFVRTNGTEVYYTVAGDFYFGGIGAGSKMHLYAANTDIVDIGATGIFNGVSTNLLIGTAAPTIGSGFGTSPSILSSNGSTTFRINVGTGGTATGGVISMPTAATGWNCTFGVLNPSSTNLASQNVMTASNTTTVTISNELTSTGIATAWPASTTILATCLAY